MSDLVERLRRRRDQEAVGCDNLPVVGYTGDGRLLGDAADALEQKDAEIERLWRMADWDGRPVSEEIRLMRRETERLQAALERCAKIAEAEPEVPDEMPECLYRIPVEELVRAAIRATKKSIAKSIREALGQKETKDG